MGGRNATMGPQSWGYGNVPTPGSIRAKYGSQYRGKIAHVCPDGR